MELFTDICLKEYPYVAYADAFHTMRSMLLPVLYLLTAGCPKRMSTTPSPRATAACWPAWAAV